MTDLKIWNRTDYREAVLQRPMEEYWTEIQWLEEGKYDLVSAKLHRGFVSNKPEVYRWWHSQQRGYWSSPEEVMETAKSWGDERDLFLVDMRNN